MKMSEASGQLANLNYQNYNLKDLLDIAKSINNFKQVTLKSIVAPTQYDSSNSDLVKLSELKICTHYQRKMRLKKLVDKLRSFGGFNKETAGHIDVAVRPNGDMYVWDGFRRAFMAGLVGLECIPVSRYNHPANRTEKQCEEYEALMFKMRNADTETMKQEEIFRSTVVYREPEALQFLDFLRECKLDVEGLNLGNKSLGGFVQLFTAWNNQHISLGNLVSASEIIQKTWSNDPLVSGYLLCGIGKFLDVNDEVDSPIDIQEIQEAFHKYIDANPPKKQDSLTGRRLNKAPNQSIAYCIALYVLGLKGKQLEDFVFALKLDEEDCELITEG
jgi:hypothetical protein